MNSTNNSIKSFYGHIYLCSFSLTSVNIDCLCSNPGLSMISIYNDFITPSKLLMKQNL